MVRLTDPTEAFEGHRVRYFGTGGLLNPLGLSIPEVDALLARAASARTDTQQQDALHELHRTLHAEAHALFLWQRGDKSVWSVDLRGNTITPGVYWTNAGSWKL